MPTTTPTGSPTPGPEVPGDRRWVLATVAVAGLAALLAVWATARGAGLTADSATYVAGAERLRSHPFDLFALTVPVGEADLFPPLYPAALALLAPVTGDAIGAARVLGVIVAAAVPLLAAALVRPVAGGAGAFAAAVVLVVGDGFVVLVAGQAMADGLFLVLALGALVVLAGLRRREAGPVAHLLVGVLGALAVLTRLTGVALVPALALGTAMGARSHRAARVVAVVGPAVVGLGVWAAGRGDVGGREVAWHPPALVDLRLGSENVAKWLLPEGVVGRAGVTITVAVAVALVALLVLAVRRQVRCRRTGPLDPAGWTEAVLVTWAVGQVLVVMGTRVVLDANLPLDQRLLFPAWVAGVLAVTVASRDLRVASWPRAARLVVGAAAAVVLLAAAGQLVIDGRAAHGDGQGYAAGPWVDSATMAAVRAGPARATNAPDAVYLRRGIVLDDLPTRYDTTTGRPDPSYPRELDALVAAVRAEGGAVYWFTAVDRPSLPSLDALVAAGLEVTERLDDGVVLT